MGMGIGDRGDGRNMPELRDSLSKNRSCKAMCIRGLVGISQGVTKVLWGGLVKGESGRSLGAGSEQDCLFWVDKMVPLNLDFYELYKI